MAWIRSQDRMTLIDGALFGVETEDPRQKMPPISYLMAGKETCSDVVIGRFTTEAAALAELDKIQEWLQGWRLVEPNESGHESVYQVSKDGEG